MCSFDVFLYYQIPLDEIIQSCLTKLYFPPDPPTLPRSVLKDLLEFATKKKSYLLFDGQYYDQIGGVVWRRILDKIVIGSCTVEHLHLHGYVPGDIISFSMCCFMILAIPLCRTTGCFIS